MDPLKKSRLYVEWDSGSRFARNDSAGIRQLLQFCRKRNTDSPTLQRQSKHFALSRHASKLQNQKHLQTNHVPGLLTVRRAGVCTDTVPVLGSARGLPILGYIGCCRALNARLASREVKNEALQSKLKVLARHVQTCSDYKVCKGTWTVQMSAQLLRGASSPIRRISVEV